MCFFRSHSHQTAMANGWPCHGPKPPSLAGPSSLDTRVSDTLQDTRKSLFCRISTLGGLEGWRVGRLPHCVQHGGEPMGSTRAGPEDLDARHRFRRARGGASLSRIRTTTRKRERRSASTPHQESGLFPHGSVAERKGMQRCTVLAFG